MDFLPHFGMRYLLGDVEAEVEFEDRPHINFNDRLTPWDMQDRKFVKLFRLSKPLARNLCQELEPRLPAAGRASAIPYDIRVLTALRFMASGSYQECVGQNRYLAMSQSSVSNCLHSVCDAMMPMLGNHVKFPHSQMEMSQVKLGFWEKYQFPGTIGAIDGTHIAIASPPKLDRIHPEHVYVNRKNFHSINTQIIADSDKRILSIWARYPGSTHDSFIWNNSRVKEEMNARYDGGMRSTWLIGDSGYGLEPILMKPFDNALDGSAEERYNKSLRKARSTVECTIGLLKNRFRCLLKERTLHYYPPVAAKIIHCCSALHNICLNNNVPLLLGDGQNLVIDEIIPIDPAIDHYNRGLITRNTIVRNYFNN